MTTTINASTSSGLVNTADTSGILQLQTANTAALTIDASQNVGIGTASPSAPLNLKQNGTGAGNGLRINAQADDSSFNIYSTGTTWNLLAGYSSTGSYQPVTFYTGGSERMRITSGGAVLIGTTSATNTFVVSSASGGTAVAQIINTSSSGNVISVASTLQSNGNNTSSAHYQGNTTGVGNWYLFGNGTSSYSSDERLKKNIETTRSGYLEDLCKLRVVKYNWRLDEEGKNKELGLIAQEVEQVFPNLVQDDLNPVSQDDDTIYKQLKQSVLPFMLLKAIQELNAKVDALEAQLGAK